MSITILCIEPDARPNTLSLTVEEGEALLLCLLEPEGGGSGGRALRATALRRREEPLPSGAEGLLELGVVRPAGGAPALRVLATNPRRPLEWVRPEGRRHLTQGVELRQAARCELASDPPVTLQLALSERGGGAGLAVSGSGTRRSSRISATKGALWLLPTVWVLLTDFSDQVVENARDFAVKLGLTPRMAGTLSALFFLALGNIVQWRQRAAMTEAAALEQERAADALGAAQAASQAALAGEQACLAERADQALRLGELAAERQIRASAALAAGASKATALALGGRRMQDEATLAQDALLLAGLTEQVVAGMSTVEAPADAARCLEHAPLLGSDLPRYALLWHPDPELSCPEGYLAVREGSTLAGRWGLSARIAAARGMILSADGAADPRLEDRAAAVTFLETLREVQTALLTARTGARAPVAPSQASLWTLALYGAVADLPAPAEGMAEVGAGTCVSEALDQLVTQQDAPAPGEPVLPNLVAVALGERALPLIPSPSCPWREGALQEGAKRALLAASRLAWTLPVEGG